MVTTKEEALNSDLFFDVQLIRRGKDHPNLPAANYTFKTYYFDSIERFETTYDEIKKCCDVFGLRAYMSVNAKSKQEASNKTLERYAHNNVMGEFRKPWRDFSSVCGGLDGKEKRWIIDVDDTNFSDGQVEEYKRLVNMCDSKYETNVIITIPTKTGVHIITHPFNIKQLNDLCEYNKYDIPTVQKNHLTLLYENLY